LTLSRTTVVAAYDALREGGWLESRSGSGTWVSIRSTVVAAARSAAQAGALAASPLLGLLAPHEQDDIIDFALWRAAATHRIAFGTLHPSARRIRRLVYDRLYHPLGLPALRGLWPDYYCKVGLNTKPEQVLITNGAQLAIALCAALYLQRGDPVLVEDPSYFGALDAFRAAGARISTLPVGGRLASHPPCFATGLAPRQRAWFILLRRFRIRRGR